MKLTIDKLKINDVIHINNNEIKILDINNGKYKIFLNNRIINFNSINDLFNFLCDTENNYNKVFTHNCQMRIICGRLGTIASMMALGNSLGTTIDGKHPGAGAISSNGSIDMIQYYFASHNWLTEWFRKRGLNELGYEPNRVEKEQVLETLEGEENLELTSETVNIDFAGVHGEIDKSKDQKFEEV